MVDVLLLGSGSGRSPVTFAVFGISEVRLLGTSPLMVKVKVAVGASVPIFSEPVHGNQLLPSTEYVGFSTYPSLGFILSITTVPSEAKVWL